MFKDAEDYRVSLTLGCTNVINNTINISVTTKKYRELERKVTYVSVLSLKCVLMYQKNKNRLEQIHQVRYGFLTKCHEPSKAGVGNRFDL